MKKITRLLAFSIMGVTSATSWSLSAQETDADDLIINEVMQSNIDCIMDNLKEFPDSWVELYNPTASTLNLGDYKLGTSKKAEKAYQFPASMTLEPYSYILIYCDKENSGLHADFRVDSGKESLYLFKDGEAIDIIDLKAQPSPNISFGRETDGSENWGYQITPTPGSANTGEISDVVLGDPLFSVPGRVGTESISLELYMPEGMPEETVIRYTTDGSEPTTESDLYEGPVQIDTTCVVRAKLFCEGAISPRSLAQSYIFHHAEMTIPIVSLVLNPEFLYDDEIGILSPNTEGNWNGNHNYDFDWRRPANIEYFDSEGSASIINQLGEIRIKGATSRKHPVKSFIMYANKRFGTKRFSHEFFPQQKPGITEFKSLELRNAGNDYAQTYMRDALSQRMMGENADLDWQAWQPTVVYINGEYYGILNLRERANEDYIYSNYDGLEDVDLIENFNTLKEGSWDNFNAFQEFYSEEGHSLAEYEEQMDIKEFTNYLIMQMFYANNDFPANNMIMWRPIEEGGKWRWIGKDLDCALGWGGVPIDFDYIDWLHNPENYPALNWACTPESTLLFRQLLALDDYRDFFIDHFMVYLGDFLTGEKTVEKIEEMADIFAAEWPYHADKNRDPATPPLWAFHNSIKNFIRQRYELIHSHLQGNFGLGNPVPVKIESSASLQGRFAVQGIELINDEFNGKAFAGRELRVSLIGEIPDDFGGWTVRVNDADGNESIDVYNAEELALTVPEAAQLTIKPRSEGYISGIEEIFEGSDEGKAWIYYTPEGVLCKSGYLNPGLYIRTNGKVSEKVIIK